MIGDFDADPISGRLALWCGSVTGEGWIRITEPTGETIGEIPPELLPLRLRWAPDGRRLTFSTNDGRIGLYDRARKQVEFVFEDRSMQAGFSQWSPEGTCLVFSAYKRPIDARRPPDIFCLTLKSSRLDRLTASRRAVDRFPNWSPSGQWIAFHRQELEELDKPKRACLFDLKRRSVSVLLPGSPHHQFGRFPWSHSGQWFSLSIPGENGETVRVVDLAGRDSGWRWEEGPLVEGAFSPSSPRLLCILPDELVWVQFPEGRVESRARLESGIRVQRTLTGHAIAFGADGASVFFLSTDHKIRRWDGAEEFQVVTEHVESLPDFRFEEFTVPAADGLALPAQRQVPSSPREIAVLYVYGGGGTLDKEDPRTLALLKNGFEVVSVAYRGSSGFGQRLRRANRGVGGLADVQDVIDCGIYWRQHYGKGRQIGLFGNSYGGFLSLLALANASSPFVGGITTCPALSLRSLPLSSDRLLPLPPEEREKALEARAVLTQAASIKRPTLLFHGALDSIATTSEMEQVENHINNSGGDCKLVVFDDDTHSLARHREEIFRSATRFYEKCLSKVR